MCIRDSLHHHDLGVRCNAGKCVAVRANQAGNVRAVDVAFRLRYIGVLVDVYKRQLI